MKVCFPTENYEGLDSKVFGHFGSAPAFVIVDSESLGFEEVKNDDQHHAHGMCQPLKALGGRRVDAVAVAGIGMGALMKLGAQGIRVFRVVSGTVRENVALLKEGKIAEFGPENTCQGHMSDGGCAHS
ncbi:MAG: NifB/NifX family molybdenum-iron cluster-binding protein [Syntrophobacteraceae bacterium]